MVKKHITYMKHIKIQSCHIRGHNYAKASDTEKATMCTYIHSDHALPHWKCVLRCCAKFPCINIHDQETDNQCSGTTSSIRFHIYHIIGLCTYHSRILLKDKKYVTCVNNNLHQINLQIYAPEKR